MVPLGQAARARPPPGRPWVRPTGRPNLEANLGFSRQEVIGDVRLALPLLENIVRVEQDDTYYLFWASPRAAVEFALSDKDSINFMTGYTFFFDHGHEFDNVLVQAFWRRRF